MKERVKFALEWERRWKATRGGRVGMAEPCRMSGIGAPTGYFMESRALAPLATTCVEEFILDARRERRAGARANCARGSSTAIDPLARSQDPHLARARARERRAMVAVSRRPCVSRTGEL